MVATEPLRRLAERYSVPITWLVESHRDIRERNIPQLFPDMLHYLLSAEQDEVGAHIHWARDDQLRLRYPVEDREWVTQMVAHSRDQLGQFGVVGRSFRGGAFIYVPGLASVLARTGYRYDSTVLRGRCRPNEWGGSAWKLWASWSRRFPGRPRRPYCPDHENVLVRGESQIIELPAYLNPLDSGAGTHVIAQARACPSTPMVLFLHICELTCVDSGPDSNAELDRTMLARLERLFNALADLGTSFCTMSSLGAALTVCK